MNYRFNMLKIEELIEIIEKNQLDLSPSYQREFIWSLGDQKDLIKTINKGYPLPNIFINVLKDGRYEMVDGQQRSRSIYRFFKNEIKFTKRDNIDLSRDTFLKYQIPVVFIDNALPDEIREFYVLINKKGKFLNNAENQRSEFHDTLFLRLAEEMTGLQSFINLDLFTKTANVRLNNREFVQELLGYLYMNKIDSDNNKNAFYEGIRDKKTFIEKEIFENDITKSEFEELEKDFIEVINKIGILNDYSAIKDSRYKQRNDFYTLFNFIHKHDYLSNELLLYQYEILLELDKKDSEGNQLIRPTNDDCESLRDYAINCVSQSNSKTARKKRLDFFESILLNTESDEENNAVLFELLGYLGEIYGEENVMLKELEETYYLLDVDLLNS